MKNKLFVIIGAYGSGKSEYSINLARTLNRKGENVSLVDLDVVNPYFRSRDVRDAFAKEGIDVIGPEGEFSHADLPMISPRIMGAIKNYERTVILDVGGDPAGCRTLARFRKEIMKRGFEMIFVVNTKRPFTSDEKGIIEMIDMLEQTASLRITEIVCNTNLMEFTTQEVIEEGILMLNKISQQKEIPFNKYLVMDRFSDIVADNLLGKKRVILNYFLSKPWENLIMKGI